MKCRIILGIMFALSTAPAHQVVCNFLIICHGSYSGTLSDQNNTNRTSLMALSFPPPPRAFDRQLIFSFQKGANHPRRLSWRIQYPNVGAMGKVQMPYPWDSVKIILYSNVVVFSWALIEREKSIFYLANSLLKFDFDCYSWSQLHGMVLYEAYWNWLKLMVKTINYYLFLLYFQVGGAAITSK